MSIKGIALSCALLAICLSYLPNVNGQEACTAPDTPAGCIDCTDEANADNAVCVTTTTVAAETTTAATGTDTTTAATGTDTTTAASGTDTTTAASGGCSGGGKIRRKRKWVVVRKPGKTTIKRRRNGNKWGHKG